MASVSDKAIAELTSRLREFSRQYPSSPCSEAVQVIQVLHEKYKSKIVGSLKAQPKNKAKKRTRRRTKLMKGASAYERVMSNYEVDEATGCWVWCGSGTDYHGYIKDDRKNNTGCHRVVYEHHHNCVLESNQHVLHTCDNGFCVNPDHLALGSHLDNMRDKVKRGRGNGQIFTIEEAKKVLIRFRSGESASVLADEYGCHKTTIVNIGRKSYKELLEDPDVKSLPNPKKTEKHGKLREEDVRDIKRRMADGESNREIAKDYPVDVAHISAIRTGVKWKSVIV